jgi:hypothetical protein
MSNCKSPGIARNSWAARLKIGQGRGASTLMKPRWLFHPQQPKITALIAFLSAAGLMSPLHTCAASRSAPSAPPVMRAADFVDTLGVATHIAYTDGGYGNIANIAADLRYLGVNRVRDGISAGEKGSAPLSSYIALARRGIRFAFVIADATTANVSVLRSKLNLADQVIKAVPGSIAAIEGANEINNWPVTYNGVSGLDGALQMQRDLYSLVHSDPYLLNVPVYYFTGYGVGGVGSGPDPANTPGLADYNNQHPYPLKGQPPHEVVNRRSFVNALSSAGPAVFTETGYTTTIGSWMGGVSQDVQARYTLDLLMDAAADGIATTYVYELMDAYKPDSKQGDAGFGLFDPLNQPKAAAKAIRNLTAILNDPAETARSFSKGRLPYSTVDLPETGRSLLLEKANGVFDIVVWNEPAIWDNVERRQTAAPSVPITLQVKAPYKGLKIFDPVQSANPVRSLEDAGTVSLSLTDHPLLVEVEGASLAGRM